MFDRKGIFQMFGGAQGFQNRFNNFGTQFSQQSQITPEQRVKQLLNSGQMSQEGFEFLRNMANSITGKQF